MSEKRFTSNGQWIAEGIIVDICDNGKVIMQVFDNDNIQNIVDLLNELHEETQLLKCALALDEVTNISLNDKKVDIPPYYEFENYQQLKKERREEYDEYW